MGLSSGAGDFEGASVPSLPTLTKGLPDIPSSMAGGRIGTAAGLGKGFSGWRADIEGRWGRLSVDAERLAGGFDISDDARPRDEVESPGRTKVSSLGEDVDIDAAARGGTRAGVGRLVPMAVITRSTTVSWSKSRCFLLVTSQYVSLSIFEASRSSSWQHTGVAVVVKESAGCSRGALDRFSRACVSLCLRARPSTIR